MASNVMRGAYQGANNQTIHYDLVHLNYTNQTCLDFSTTVVQEMSSTRPSPSITWLVGDVRSMPAYIPPSSISVAFDKGTLDAMIHGSPWDPPDDVMQNAKTYMGEVQREGMFLYVTYRQPHFVRPLLEAAGE